MSEELNGKEKSLANLKPFVKADKLTEEEKNRQSEICKMGAYATAEKKRQKRNLQQTALWVLEKRLSREEAKKLIGDKAQFIDDENLDMQTVLSVALATTMITDGNAKAYEVLRDTSGQTVKNKSEIEINGNIMTDADRALMEKIQARLSATDGI